MAVYSVDLRMKFGLKVYYLQIRFNSFLNGCIFSEFLFFVFLSEPPHMMQHRYCGCAYMCLDCIFLLFVLFLIAHILHLQVGISRFRPLLERLHMTGWYDSGRVCA